MKTIAIVFLIILNVYSLAPTYTIPDEVYEKLLLDTMYTTKERNILTKIKNGNDPYKIMEYVQTISEIYLKGNLSLFTHIQNIWKTLPGGEYKNVIYDTLLYIGTSITINDYSIHNKWNQRIMRTTFRGRLRTHIKIINTILSGNNDVFYDIGSSFGSETFEIYNFMNSMKRLSNKEFHAIDINIIHYILYDTSKHIKIVINALGQISSARYTSNNMIKPNIPYYELDSIDTDLYLKTFNHLRMDTKFNISADKQFILEKVELIDPRFLSNSNLFYHQVDAKQEYPKEWKDAKLIRIYNLLPYFELNDQILFIKNAINKLDSNGYILFNLVNYSEENIFMFLYEHSTRTVFSIYGDERWIVLNRELSALTKLMNRVHGKNWKLKKVNYIDRINLST